MMQSCFSLLLGQGRLALPRFGPQLLSAAVSTSAHSAADDGRPPPSGDRGRREKNYQRNQAKKERSQAQRTTKAIDMQSLLKGMRKTDGQTKDNTAALKDILAGIKVHVPPNDVTRRRLGMPAKSSLTRPEREVARLKSERLPANSMYPSAGPRLGLFSLPGPDTKVMPPARPNLAEREHAEMVASMQRLKPTNHFEMSMTDIAFPRQFPIDNETANNDEDGVGFEDHVLLNHLMKGFPTRGPVRHFMEMVVTGLSKNPHYTAQEKRDYVQWYRDYFAQFSDEELQNLSSTVKSDTEQS